MKILRINKLSVALTWYKHVAVKHWLDRFCCYRDMLLFWEMRMLKLKLSCTHLYTGKDLQSQTLCSNPFCSNDRVWKSYISLQLSRYLKELLVLFMVEQCKIFCIHLIAVSVLNVKEPRLHKDKNHLEKRTLLYVRPSTMALGWPNRVTLRNTFQVAISLKWPTICKKSIFRC